MNPWIVEAPGLATLDGYEETATGVLHVWCTACREWHLHGVPEGHRAAHCRPEKSRRFRWLGYDVVRRGEWPGDVPHGTEARYFAVDGSRGEEVGCRCDACCDARGRAMNEHREVGRRPGRSMKVHED